MSSGRIQPTPATLQALEPQFQASLLLLGERGAVLPLRCLPPLILLPRNLHVPCLPIMDHFPAEIFVYF